MDFRPFSVASRVLLLAPVVALFCTPAQAKRKDVVIMNNGDHFTGQVKRLENGLLYIETDYVTGNIGLDWNQVQSIESTATYRIVLNDGRRLEGKIEKHTGEKEKKEDFVIREATEEEEVPSAEIFSLDTKKPTFWRDLQGAIDLGYSFTSGNSQSSMNLDTSAAYQTPKWRVATSFDSTFSGQSGGSTTNREDLQASAARFLNRNSFVLALSDFLHSSQQDLNLRATLDGRLWTVLETDDEQQPLLGRRNCLHSRVLRYLCGSTVGSEYGRLSWACNTLLFASTSESSTPSCSPFRASRIPAAFA